MNRACNGLWLVPALMAYGCQAIVGIEDVSEAPAGAAQDATPEAAGGAAGSAGEDAAAGEAGSVGDASVEADAVEDASGCDGGAQPLGKVGDPCCKPGELACAGHAQKLVLICDPKSQTWTALQSCPGNQLCDSTVGSSQGTCQDPVALCIGKQPGYKVCDGLKAIECGPDLVTATETTCAYACADGECTGVCAPGSKDCLGLTPRTCDGSGQWQNGAPCAYVCSSGECTGVCTPGSKQCSGKVPQTCSASGQWVDGTACANACELGACVSACTEGVKQCSGKVPQTCTGGVWVDGTACEHVCSGGDCIGVCDPGATRCSGLVPQTCDANGQWQNGTACPYVCTGGTCSGECTPGSKDCVGLTPRTCDSSGLWQSGPACAYVCASGACTGVCSPGAMECSGQTPRSCDASGQWQNGSACVNQACVSGVCQGVCSPEAKQCSGQTPQSCDASGQWQSGSPCVNQACVSGVCQGVCAPGSKQCSGSTPQTCDASGQWQNGTPCGDATPVCSGGQCVVPPSCDGLPATCGPNGNDSCCTSIVVPGGTFDRFNNPGYPATVSDFRMDKYEITVGRFRKFVQAYPGNKPVAGAGKNPNNPVDPGWDATWNDTNMPPDQVTLMGGLKCNAPYYTWTYNPGSNENRPITCISWYEAFAFCIWDGGRLPTEAEWTYAAAGGSEEREYPWSNPPNSTTIDCTNASYDCNNNSCGDGTFGCQVTDILDVGMKPNGNGKWGQSDLQGNVREWLVDWVNNPPNPCTNCANFTPNSNPQRLFWGGSFSDSTTSMRLTSYRCGYDPMAQNVAFGARCVRSP